MKQGSIVWQDARPEHNDDIVSRRILNELLLVPIRRTAGDIDSLYTLNEVAAFVWETLDGTTPVHDIYKKVIREFDIDIETATLDVNELLIKLHEIGAVKGF